MRTLYHWPLDPQSRQVRIALEEKKLRVKLVHVNPWEISEELLVKAPEGKPPILLEAIPGGQIIITGSRAICEYAEDHSGRQILLPGGPGDRAEARRLCAWFDDKFQEEVNAYILSERLEKTLTAGGAPHPPTLRQGREQLQFHLDYMSWLLEKRSWLAGQEFSLADIAAGANISCLDYFGEIPWKSVPDIKNWYQKLKSRPSFRPLLKDHIPGLIPPRHYADLDF
ncbi:MAG: glutathione S-transferase family protein [Hellea sp.]|nr:glutathione S-transferase family protein [Hellea sp.]